MTPTKPPYWVLEAMVEHLSQRVEVLSQCVERLEREREQAQRDPAEYRRGYMAGHHAASRGAPCSPDSVRRRRPRSVA